MRPRYFDDFYAMIEQSPGNFYALVRSDGRLLARYPAGPQLTHQLSPQSELRVSIDGGLTHGLYSANSEVDGHNRRVGFRELPGYPVYAIAGIDSAAIRAAWLHQVGDHLIFGLPVTLLLFPRCGWCCAGPSGSTTRRSAGIRRGRVARRNSSKRSGN